MYLIGLVSISSSSFCMFRAFSSFYIGFKTIGTLFQFLHYLSIGTTIQPHHKHHRNKNEPYNEPQNPIPTTTIQNKQQNLKTQTKPKQPEDLKGELKANIITNSTADEVYRFRGSQRRIEGAWGHGILGHRGI